MKVYEFCLEAPFFHVHSRTSIQTSEEHNATAHGEAALTEARAKAICEVIPIVIDGLRKVGILMTPEDKEESHAPDVDGSRTKAGQ